VKKNIDLTQLYKQKRYSEIIYIMESKFSEDEKNISIIYLLGLCRLLKNNRTIEDYIFKAKELSFQTDKLVNLRKEIFENLSISPLFDVNSFSNDFFNVLKKLKFNK
jgi:predicted O-linked N-acetylglucosamine transferase (SPINDLY family)